MTSSSVELDGVRCTFDRNRVVALDGVHLHVPAGLLTVVVGASGSGKSTLLRCVAGLERVDAGAIRIAGRDVTHAPAGLRDVGLAFQDLALFPHLDVAANIGFGLRARKVAASTRRQRVAAVADALGIDGLLTRRPHELSGGEAQRVALARAIVRDPAALLLDEPFGALDPARRSAARGAVRAAQSAAGVTTVLVTHDPLEALALADHLVVLVAGRVVQAGNPRDVHDRPVSPTVAALVGTPPMSVVPGALVGRPGRTVGLRPTRLRLTAPANHEEPRLTGQVDTVEFLGDETLVAVLVDGHRIAVRVPRQDQPRIVAGDPVGVTWAEGEGAVWEFEDRA